MGRPIKAYSKFVLYAKNMKQGEGAIFGTKHPGGLARRLRIELQRSDVIEEFSISVDETGVWVYRKPYFKFILEEDLI